MRGAARGAESYSPTVRRDTLSVLQANAKVALLQPAEDRSFDYWLRLSTLEKGQPVCLPVTLTASHQQALAGKTLNTSTVLARKVDGWWLTLSYEEQVTIQTPNPPKMRQDAPVMGSDVGSANVITDSTAKQYGTFNGKLAERHKRDREKRRRKAKLRACLKKKGVKRLPSTRNKKRARTVRQAINRAVNDLYREYPEAQFAYEHLHVAGMKFKARRMNAYLDASHLAHIPAPLAWGAQKRGIRARKVKSAYSSQECHRCH
jgi:transposase